VKEPSEIYVVLGMNQIGNDTERVHRQAKHVSLATSKRVLDDREISFQPRRVLPHPDYNKPSRFDNDVALLLFDKPGFIVNDFVLPICLWKDDYDFGLIAGKNGEVFFAIIKEHFYSLHSQVVGWGVTEENERAEDLQKAVLKVEPYLDCYLKDPKFFGKRLKPGQNFCAGNNG